MFCDFFGTLRALGLIRQQLGHAHGGVTGYR